MLEDRDLLLSIAVKILKFDKITYYHKISQIYGVSRAAPHVRQYETIDLFTKRVRLSSYENAREKLLLLLNILHVKESI